MSIWLYNEHQIESKNAIEAFRLSCIFCGTDLIRYTEDENNVVLFDELNYGFSDNFRTRCYAVIGICPACGWWKYGVGTYIGGNIPTSYEMKAARLKKMNISDISIPIYDIRSDICNR